MYDSRNLASSGEITQTEKNLFLQAVGETRQNLRRFHDYLKEVASALSAGENPTISDIEKAVQDFVSINKGLLEEWDRKPVFGNGIELRLQNELCGLFTTDNSVRIILDQIDEGRIDDALAQVRISEKILTDIYRGLSGDKTNPTMIHE